MQIMDESPRGLQDELSREYAATVTAALRLDHLHHYVDSPASRPLDGLRARWPELLLRACDTTTSTTSASTATVVSASTTTPMVTLRLRASPRPVHLVAGAPPASAVHPPLDRPKAHQASRGRLPLLLLALATHRRAPRGVHHHAESPYVSMRQQTTEIQESWKYL